MNECNINETNVTVCTLTNSRPYFTTVKGLTDTETYFKGYILN